MLGAGTLAQLPQLREFRSRRSSSYEVTGGNCDWWEMEPGGTLILLDEHKPGCIKHIWMTVGHDDTFPRKMVLRMYWDDQRHPAVEVPLGDFFGIGHGVFKNFVSLPLQMSPEDGRGMNCWWPMPFDKARVSLENQGDQRVNVYFYIDYEEYEEPHGPDIGRFCACWNRENPTEGWLKDKLTPENHRQIWADNPNLSDRDNYLILEAEGDGVYVGCNLNIDCFERHGNDWYGEGDDMIVIDGEPWPPRLHGTGTEDYFNTAFGPSQEYCAPYHGITLNSGDKDWPWRGKNSMYRFHIEDPIRFRKSIRVSIEHGEANALSNDYSSTAYWYQKLPSKPFRPLPAVELRLPRV
ncbi:MAG TPA: glycoside hydrolase family 172 protein [Fimbriimonadaceae bacterium]|nr:glycoside hydrolase family 172 protein [Fimbriimonadaceae bacterium]